MISASKFIYFLSCILAVAFFTACKNKTVSQKAIVEKKSRPVTSKNDYDSLITTPCALVLYPTDKQIDSMKKKDGEDFYTIADDNQFYMANCLEYLDSVKLKTITKDSKGVLAFKTQNNQLYKLKLDTLSWSVILFNGKTKPYHTDITLFQDDYRSYMK